MHSLPVLVLQSLEQWWQSYGETNNRVLRYCQVLLMTSILFLSLTSAGIQQLLWQNMEQLLGADLVISHSTELSVEERDALTKYSRNATLSQLVDATLTHEGQWQAVQVKVVDSSYPLRGSVQITQELGGVASQTAVLPTKDEIWLDNRTISALKVTVGDVISVAGRDLRVSAILTHEPDRLLEGHSVAHRAMITNAQAHQALFTNAAVTYRYGFEIDPSVLPVAIKWANEHLAHASVLHMGSGHPLASFWQRVENFFGLVMVVLFFMAAITFSLSGKRQLEKQLFRFSLFLSFGVSRGHAVFVWCVQWFIGFMVSVVIATLFAYAGYAFAMEKFAGHFALTLSASNTFAAMSISAWLKGVLLLAILLLLFQAPFWLKLFRTSPAILLKKAFEGQRSWVIWLFNSSVICLLALFYSDNPLLTTMTLSGLAVTLLLMVVVTWLFLTLGEKVQLRRSSLLVFCLGLMKQRMSSKATQIMGLGLCITLMLFSFGLMRDFSNMLQRYTRTHDGNLIISQVTQNQRQSLERWATKHDADILVLKPFYSAKLIAINGESLNKAIAYPSDTSATLKKTVRLHTTPNLPANNIVSSGTFWQEGAERLNDISVESEVMTDLRLTLGDILQFRIGTQEFDFTIRATHAFKPGAGSVTFWFQTPQALSEQIHVAPMYMGSMELPDNAWPHLAALWREMPTLKMVTLKEITQRFDDTLHLLQMTLTLFSALILILSLLVVISTIQSFQAQDKTRNGLMLSFGMSKQECIRLVTWEWLITGLIASSSAIIGTILIGHLMYKSQFSMNYNVDWLWLLSVTALTIIGAIVVGLLFSRDSLKVSIRQLLQEG